MRFCCTLFVARQAEGMKILSHHSDSKVGPPSRSSACALLTLRLLSACSLLILRLYSSFCFALRVRHCPAMSLCGSVRCELLRPCLTEHPFAALRLTIGVFAVSCARTQEPMIVIAAAGGYGIGSNSDALRTIVRAPPCSNALALRMMHLLPALPLLVIAAPDMLLMWLCCLLCAQTGWRAGADGPHVRLVSPSVSSLDSGSTSGLCAPVAVHVVVRRCRPIGLTCLASLMLASRCAATLCAFLRRGNVFTPMVQLALDGRLLGVKFLEVLAFSLCVSIRSFWLYPRLIALPYV